MDKIRIFYQNSSKTDIGMKLATRFFMSNNDTLISLYEATSYLGYRNINSVLKLIKNGFLTCYTAPDSTKKMVSSSEVFALAVPDNAN